MGYHTPSPVVVNSADTQSSVYQVRGHSIPRIKYKKCCRKISQSGGVSAPHVGEQPMPWGGGGQDICTYIHI